MSKGKKSGPLGPTPGLGQAREILDIETRLSLDPRPAFEAWEVRPRTKSGSFRAKPGIFQTTPESSVKVKAPKAHGRTVQLIPDQRRRAKVMHWFSHTTQSSR